MSRPVQQRRQVEYATKVDVDILTAEVRGLRESTEARLNAHDQALERIERTLERIDQRFDD